MNTQRVAVLEEGDLEVGRVVPPQVFEHGGARPQTKSFASETAAITGESKRDVNRHIAHADTLGDDLERLVSTNLDKGVQLVLAVESDSTHRHLVRRHYRVMRPLRLDVR